MTVTHVGQTVMIMNKRKRNKSFAINVCQSDHPVYCDCWPVLDKDLLYTRNIYRTLRDTTRLESNGRDGGSNDIASDHK